MAFGKEFGALTSAAALLVSSALGRPDNPVLEAYLVADRFALDVTSKVREMMVFKNGLAGDVDVRELTNREDDVHLYVRYRTTTGEEYGAIVFGSWHLDADVEAEDKRASFLDDVISAYIERDGKPLVDVMSHLVEVAGPDLGFGVSEESEFAPRPVWRYMPLSYIVDARVGDKLVLVMEGQASNVVKRIDDTFFDADLNLTT